MNENTNGGNTVTDRRSFIRSGVAGVVLGAQGCVGPGGDRLRDDTGMERVKAELQRYGGSPESEAWGAVREQFTLKPNLTYLNTAGLGPSPRAVIDTMVRDLHRWEAISESGHGEVEAVRARACRLLGCRDDEIGLTRNTTEGMNAIARGLSLNSGDEVLLSTHEHPGGAMPWFALARDCGIAVRRFEPGRGWAETLEHIAGGLTARTRVVSVSHVTCTTGYVLPVPEIAELCRNRGIVSVIDGAQAVGMIPVNLHELGCDCYASCGHKWLLGPKGTGFLYIRRGMLSRWRPTWVGAYSDERFDLDAGVYEPVAAARSVEYGTRNTPMILGLGAAMEFLQAIGVERVAAYGRALATRLVSQLQRAPGIELMRASEAHATGSIVTFRCAGSAMDPWQWCHALKGEYGIRVRPVGEHGLNGVRVSAHVFNTPAQIDRVASAIVGLCRSR